MECFGSPEGAAFAEVTQKGADPDRIMAEPLFGDTLPPCPECKNSERLASLGIMGAQFRVLLKPLNTIECAVMYRGFQGGPQFSPHDA